MTWLKIDDSRCTRCGLCLDDCPLSDMLFFGPGEPNEPNERFCIHCGHCAAICPEDAVTLDDVSEEALQTTDTSKMPEFESVAHLMRTRRSTRSFNGRPLSRQTLSEIIDAANHAPSSINSRQVRWLVVTTKEERERVVDIVSEWMEKESTNGENPYASYMKALADSWVNKGVDQILFHAPALAIAHAPKVGVNAQIDCAIALTQLEIAAWSRGIGSCWAGFFLWCTEKYQPMRDLLGLPDGHLTQGALMLGYPTRKYRRIPVRPGPDIEWR